MSSKLIIVESPAKAKTIQGYLGDDYKVIASHGHLWDLPQKSLGVDISTWKIEYAPLPKKGEIINRIKGEINKHKYVYIATDPDREGEAIGFLIQKKLCNDNQNVYRLRLHSITKENINEALKKPESFDVNLYHAQKMRRILDRIIGFGLSSKLREAVPEKGSCLSAGRVQSATLLLVYYKEQSILTFKKTKYYVVYGDFGEITKAKLISFPKFNIKTGVNITDIDVAKHCVESLKKYFYKIDKIKTFPVRENTPPPFTTATLQEMANKILGFSPNKTMELAQKLYEGIDLGNERVGLITYMRTDSVRVVEEKIQEVRNYIENTYGTKYLPEKPKIYKNKDSSQDAHEAIRPTYMKYTPESIKEYLELDEYKLYSLIFERFVASQMEDAIYSGCNIHIKSNIDDAIFEKKIKSLQFEGFRILSSFKIENKEKESDEEEDDDDKEVVDFSILKRIKENDTISVKSIYFEEKETTPPPRYTFGTLVKEMEKKGIGRPSTYAATIETLMKRKYIYEKGKKIYLNLQIGKSVIEFLGVNFMRYISIDFTSWMERELDKIATGTSDAELKKFLKEAHQSLFY